MLHTVYRVADILCTLVSPWPIGTNRGLLDLLWMLLRGELLPARGGIFPGLDRLGLSPARVRRAWAALGSGCWTSEELVTGLRREIERAGHWQPERVGRSTPLAVDITGFWRPRLRDCPTSHFSTAAGKSLPAIPVGRVGRVDDQRVAVLVALVRADPDDTGVVAHNRRVVTEAVARSAPDDMLVLDSGFQLSLLQSAGATRYLVRRPKNFTGRRREPIPYCGRGKHPRQGAVVRPLARTWRGREIPATPPDRVTIETTADGVAIRAEQWTDLVIQAGTCERPGFQVLALHHPEYPTPLLLATSAPVSPLEAWELSRARWPIEQAPLTTKTLLGAVRQFVSAPETCQRWPELTLSAGTLANYLAAAAPPQPCGFWDRAPVRPTAGRFRRSLAGCPFPADYPLPARIRAKRSVTGHLRTGFWGQRPPRHHPPRPHPTPD